MHMLQAPDIATALKMAREKDGRKSGYYGHSGRGVRDCRKIKGNKDYGRV